MNKIFADQTITMLQRALDGLVLRQQVISRNVANVETPGFKASTVTFESQLQRALEQDPNEIRLAQTSAGHLAAPAPGVAAARVTQRNNLTMRQDGNNVDIEREITDLTETTLRFAATSRLLNRKLAMLRQVITEGRGGL